MQLIKGALMGRALVIAANSRMQRSNDTFYPFEQEANFWYLTHVNEPDWLYIQDGSQKRWLVMPDIDEVHETFDGSLSPEEAKSLSGVDEVITMRAADGVLRQLAKKHSVVYALGEHPQRAHFNFVENPAQATLRKKLAGIFTNVQDCRKELAQLRAHKQPDEIAAIQKAIDLTIEGFETVRSHINSLNYEYEIEAEFSYAFRKHSAQHAYDPIIAAGSNACTLHYVENKTRLYKKQFVLMDVGARVDGYAADITRTYARGELTKRQRAIHDEVRAAHYEIIDLLSPGVAVKVYSDRVDAIMKRSLINLGLITSMNDDDGYRRYFPHAISHGLGIDVHDSLGGATEFAPHMVLTVEPGIYIPEESIGIRIEDDILITNNGYKNLSAKLSTEY